MLKILILKRRTLYIALVLLIILLIGIVFFTLSGSDETFLDSERVKYNYKKVSFEQAKILLEKNPDTIVFDIRDEDEYLEGHLPNATQLTYKELKKKLDYYNPDNIYMIYGESDKKSEKAAEVMANNGFSKIYMLNGGMQDWPYEIE
ncbi:rhodanese-like domain-containing protein [Inediibacterium massiliense]|uniref:rhodanese-like domain-containing protein n=1 Tax=Inediibacterium massiliense TaxID=1658111 RepID=UPI0006B61259|nr:rhodanese-like domain-containing protein [Inediibacterium massiliense]